MRRAQTGWARIPPIAILLAGAAFVLVYSFPGYMNYDSAAQLRQARFDRYDDWHPPMMAKYWHYSDKLISGPLPLLVLQIALFLWGMSGLLKRRFQPRTAALMTVAILVFPPVIAMFAPVWKDSQMLAFLLAGVMLMFGESRSARIAGGIVLFVAAGVRDNACAALPPILLVIVASWGVRRRLAVIGIAFAVFCVITLAAHEANVVMTDINAEAWAQTNAIHDIAGTICFSDPMSDDEIRRELAGIPLHDKGPDLQKQFCDQYNPRWWFALSLNEGGLFDPNPGPADIAARRTAYRRVIGGHWKAFVRHRWTVSKELLGLGTEEPNEPVCQSFAGTAGQIHGERLPDHLSWAQQKLGHQYARLTSTLLFRPWAYALVGLVILLYAAWKRDGLVVAIVASGFLYELSFLLAAAGAPFRYSNWMIVCVCMATLIVFGDRIRAGVQERAARSLDAR